MKGNLQQVLFIVVPCYEGNSQLIRVPQCVYLDVSVIFHAFFVISTHGRKVRENATLKKLPVILAYKSKRTIRRMFGYCSVYVRVNSRSRGS